MLVILFCVLIFSPQKDLVSPNYLLHLRFNVSILIIAVPLQEPIDQLSSLFPISSRQRFLYFFKSVFGLMESPTEEALNQLVLVDLGPIKEFAEIREFLSELTILEQAILMALVCDRALTLPNQCLVGILGGNMIQMPDEYLIDFTYFGLFLLWSCFIDQSPPPDVLKLLLKSLHRLLLVLVGTRS